MQGVGCGISSPNYGDKAEKSEAVLRKRIDAWRQCTVPYTYLTMKLKCFNPLGGLICIKPLHQHYRKIVGFKKVCGHNLARRVHRAVEIIFRDLGGYEVWTTDGA